jgi:hypothetical protein
MGSSGKSGNRSWLNSHGEDIFRPVSANNGVLFVTLV